MCNLGVNRNVRTGAARLTAKETDLSAWQPICAVHQDVVHSKIQRGADAQSGQSGRNYSLSGVHSRP